MHQSTSAILLLLKALAYAHAVSLCPYFKNFVHTTSKVFQSAFNLNETDFCKFEDCLIMRCSGKLPLLQVDVPRVESVSFSASMESCSNNIYVNGTYDDDKPFNGNIQSNSESIVQLSSSLHVFIESVMIADDHNLLRVNLTAEIRVYKTGGFQPVKIISFDGLIEDSCIKSTTRTIKTTTMSPTTGLTTKTSTSKVTTWKSTVPTAATQTRTKITTTVNPTTYIPPTPSPHKDKKSVAAKTTMYVMAVGILGVVVVITVCCCRKNRRDRRKELVAGEFDDDDDDPLLSPTDLHRSGLKQA